MSLKEAFAPQVKTSRPCSGNCLGHKTFNEAVIFIQNLHLDTITVEQAEETVTRTMKEYEDHKGEYEFYFIFRDTEAMSIEVLRCWSSQLERMEATGFKWNGEFSNDIPVLIKG